MVYCTDKQADLYLLLVDNLKLIYEKLRFTRANDFFFFLSFYKYNVWLLHVFKWSFDLHLTKISLYLITTCLFFFPGYSTITDGYKMYIGKWLKTVIFLYILGTFICMQQGCFTNTDCALDLGYSVINRLWGI